MKNHCSQGLTFGIQCFVPGRMVTISSSIEGSRKGQDAKARKCQPSLAQVSLCAESIISCGSRGWGHARKEAWISCSRMGVGVGKDFGANLDFGAQMLQGWAFRVLGFGSKGLRPANFKSSSQHKALCLKKQILQVPALSLVPALFLEPALSLERMPGLQL